MRIFRGLLFAVTLAGALAGFAAERPPPHPTVLLAEYKGEQLPVVAAEKEEPVVIVDGKKKRLRGTIPLSTERMPGYGGTKADMLVTKTEVMRVVTTSSQGGVQEALSTPGATLGGYVEFAATITASQDLADCFIALIAFEEGFLIGATDRPNAQVRIRQIQNLRAGQPTPVNFSSTPFLSNRGMAVFALLFSEGNEVSTNQSPSASAYFHRRERVVHTAAVGRWLQENRTGNRPAQPVLQIPPLFDTKAGIPAEVTADLTVSPDGTVLHVGLDRSLPSSAEGTIERTLGAWLFLPRIKDGAPTLTHVAVPLRF